MTRRIPVGLLVQVALFLGCIWLVATAWSIEPDTRGHGTHEQLGLEPCGYLRRTGEPCPSCGMTTSFAHTVRFQVLNGLRANPAGTVLCILVMLFPLHLIGCWRRGEPPESILRPPRAAFLIVGLAVLIAASWWYKIRAMSGG